MNFQLLWPPLALVVASAGCTAPREQAKWVNPSMVSFSEREIRTKSWHDSAGNVVSLLDWECTDVRRGGKLLIAKYGTTETRFITCLEFYRVAESVPPPKETHYILLAHDSANSIVTSIKVEDRGTVTSVNVIRETIPGTSEKRTRYSYWLDYVDQNVIQTVPLNNTLTEISGK